MSTTFSASAVALTSGFPAIGALGLADKALVQVAFSVTMRTPALAGLLFFTFRWRDRAGTLRVHTSSGLALAGTGRIQDVVPIYLEDSGNFNAFFEWEVTTVGVLGAFEYDYYIDLLSDVLGN